MHHLISEYRDWAYLLAAILFILTLRGLSSPRTAAKGNVYGMVGMALAIVTTFFVADNPALLLILGAMLLGAGVGIYRARTVPMTRMPETIALMHSLVGMAAVLIAIAHAWSAGVGAISTLNRFELFVGCFVGAVTFTASIVAWGKLSARLGSRPLTGVWVKPLQVLLFLVMLGFGIHYFVTEDLTSFAVMTAVALVFGYFWIAPVGGGDMPVVISLLNSLSGWAAAGIGFTLANTMLIIAGSLVGASGAILSYIMCKAMNRSLSNVLFGGFGTTAPTAGAADEGQERTCTSGSPDDAAFLLSNAESVIVIPGYGLAQARAQNVVKELAEALESRGVSVRFAIHPVAGRMPGHMNVLLAEADVPYADVVEMDAINNDFVDTDVVLVIGANDVINPAAKDDPGSPIYGMPILEARKAGRVLVLKRSLSPGYAGLDNEIFYADTTMMIFGDARKTAESMVRNITDG